MRMNFFMAPAEGASVFGSRPGGFAFRLRRLVGLGRGRFGIAGGRVGGGGLLFSGFLVFVAAIVGDVEAAAFENQACAGADLLVDLAPAPLFAGAQVLRADLQRLIRDGLKQLKFVSAFGAGIF